MLQRAKIVLIDKYVSDIILINTKISEKYPSIWSIQIKELCNLDI